MASSWRASSRGRKRATWGSSTSCRSGRCASASSVSAHKTWLLLGKPGRGISATPPLEYAQRFTERVICDVFDAPLGEQMEVESASQAGAYRSQSPSHSLGQSPYQGMLPEAAIGAAGR